MATSSAMKTLWHNEHSAQSLKQFAHGLLAGDGKRKTLAQDWFAHKSGILEQLAREKRMTLKGAQLAEIRMKVHAARRKSGSKPETVKKDKGQSPTTTPVKKGK